MGWEAVESAVFASEFPPLRVLPQPDTFEVVSEPVHMAVWNISQQQIDLEKMLMRYKWNLEEFYITHGNPQSIQERIRLLESKVGPCLVHCETVEARLANLEFKYLDWNKLLTGPDSSDYFV